MLLQIPPDIGTPANVVDDDGLKVDVAVRWPPFLQGLRRGIDRQWRIVVGCE